MKKIKQNIALIGFSGCYKTTVGKILAKRLNMLSFDTDEYLEFEYSKTICEFFKEYGEKMFRQMEAKAVALTSDYQNTVISTGGGTVLNEENMRVLCENCYVVHLKASAETICKRIEKDQNRPLLNGKSVEDLNKIYDARKLLYQRYADFTVNTDRLSSEKTAQKVIDKFSSLVNGD